MLLSFLILTLYLLVFIVTALSLVRLYKLRHITAYKALIASLLGYWFMAFAAICVLAFEPIEMKILFSRLRFLGYAIISPSILIFINSLYLNWKWLEDRRTIALVYLPAVITWAVTLYPPWRDLLVHSHSLIQVGAFRVLEFKVGPWFTGHFISAYGYTLLLMVVAASAFRKANRHKRAQIAFFSLSILSVTLFEFYFVTTNDKWRWAMLPGAVYVLADISILYAGLKHRLFEVVPYATEKIFQSLSEPVIVLDNEGFIETANQAAIDLLDLKISELHDELTLAPETVRGQGPRTTIKNRHFDIVSESLQGEKGFLSGRIIYLREITTWMELEKSLMSRLQLKTTMLSLISHDVVGNLHAQATLMRSLHTSLDDRTKALIEVLVTSHETLHHFLRNILKWEKRQSQRFLISVAPFDIRVFIAQCWEVVEVMASLRSIQLLTSFDLGRDDTAIIHADSEVLGCIVRNLLANAIKASPDGSKIEVHVARRGDDLCFSIKDHGIGMNEETVKSLMANTHPNLEPVKTGNGGFGFGLTIAKQFTRMHGGRLSIASEEYRGTTVTVVIPLIKS